MAIAPYYEFKMPRPCRNTDGCHAMPIFGLEMHAGVGRGQGGSLARPAFVRDDDDEDAGSTMYTVHTAPMPYSVKQIKLYTGPV